MYAADVIFLETFVLEMERAQARPGAELRAQLKKLKEAQYLKVAQAWICYEARIINNEPRKPDTNSET